MTVTMLLSLSPGWTWVANTAWQVVTGGNSAGGEVPCGTIEEDNGWYYAIDFPNFSGPASGSTERGFAHFVRRRRILRAQIMDG